MVSSAAREPVARRRRSNSVRAPSANTPRPVSFASPGRSSTSPPGRPAATSGSWSRRPPVACPRHGGRLERRGPDGRVEAATYRFTGIAGQRASRKGALDGYRVWLRDRGDMSSSPRRRPHIALAGADTQADGGMPRRGPTPSATTDTRVVSIASGPRTTDRDVAIEAVVTAPAALLDATGRRIVVQDASGAIEVLLAKDVPAPGVGTRIRAAGPGRHRVRRTPAAGADVDRLGAGTPRPAAHPRAARRGPHLAARGGRRPHRRRTQARRPLAGRGRRRGGASGRRRPAGREDPGRRCRRGSFDRRRRHRAPGLPERHRPPADDPAAVRGDFRVGGADRRRSRGQRRAGGGGCRDGGPGGTADSAPARPRARTATACRPDADLADLASIVGGRSASAASSSTCAPTASCSTTAPRTRRSSCATTRPDWIPLIEPGDAINVVGRVERLDDGALGVVVTDPAAIVLGSDPAAAGVGRHCQPGEPRGKELAGRRGRGRTAGFGDDLGVLPGAGAGVASLLGISLASVGVTAPAAAPGPAPPGRPGGRAARRHRRQGGRRS